MSSKETKGEEGLIKESGSVVDPYWPVIACANCNEFIHYGQANIMFGGPSLDDPDVMGPTFHVGFEHLECRMVARFYKRRWARRIRARSRSKEKTEGR